MCSYVPCLRSIQLIFQHINRLCLRKFGNRNMLKRNKLQIENKMSYLGCHQAFWERLQLHAWWRWAFSHHSQQPQLYAAEYFQEATTNPRDQWRAKRRQTLNRAYRVPGRPRSRFATSVAGFLYKSSPPIECKISPGCCSHIYVTSDGNNKLDSCWVPCRLVGQSRPCVHNLCVLKFRKMIKQKQIPVSTLTVQHYFPAPNYEQPKPKKCRW
jgi:hypothetical protein